MTSQHKKILVFAILFVGSGFLFKYFVDYKKPMLTREHYKNQNIQSALIADQVTQKYKKENRQFESSANTKSVIQIPENLDELLNEIDYAVRQRAKTCEAWLNKYLVDEEYIDVNSTFYQDKDNVLWLFHESFSKVLMRKPADDAYIKIESIVNSEAKIDSIDYYTKLETLDICRFPKIINLLDTVIEASHELSWPNEDQKNIVMTILDTGLIENNPSMEGMLFQLNMARVLVESKLIPEQLGEEVEFLMNRMQEHEVTFRKGFGARYSNEDNRNTLRDYLSINRELWDDVKELMERTKYNLGL